MVLQDCFVRMLVLHHCRRDSMTVKIRKTQRKLKYSHLNILLIFESRATNGTIASICIDSVCTFYYWTYVFSAVQYKKYEVIPCTRHGCHGSTSLQLFLPSLRILGLLSSSLVASAGLWCTASLRFPPEAVWYVWSACARHSKWSHL